MIIKDKIARIKLAEVREAIKRGNDFTKPWLDLDLDAIQAYKDGTSALVPMEHGGEMIGNDPVDRIMTEGVEGMNVLCLAGSGGQQSAVFSLLGANVTVLDLCPEQLESDQIAARHYGYEVKTIQGDMRDLYMLPDNHFDRVYQPISTLFVPDLREVYSGVYRILRAGGLYSADYAVPLLYMAEQKGWDGKGYNVYVTEPYIRGAIFETEEEGNNFSHGKSYSEFHHLLSDIINGLIAEGLTICGVWENPRPDSGTSLEELEPGSELHQERYMPYGLTSLAEKVF